LFGEIGIFLGSWYSHPERDNQNRATTNQKSFII